MNSNITTAVILAAGLGSRLKHHTQDQPKGFLEVEGKSLIERSIESLMQKGIQSIIIGTGYLPEHFDALKKKFPVTTFRNEDYSTTGSMYTLYVLRHLIKESVLLLESDLLYDPVSLDYLLRDTREDVILASDATLSGDEVYIQCSSAGLLEKMSKDKTQLREINGELVGITKLSASSVQRMAQFSEPHFNNGNRMLNYEDALVGVAMNNSIHVKVIDDLAWCEIDDENHLQRALNFVLPKIKKRTQTRSPKN
jgi:2-aminoethylphosphonate-pyruvate transaminase